MRFEGTLTANPVSLKLRVSPLISGDWYILRCASSHGELSRREIFRRASQRGDWRSPVTKSSAKCLGRNDSISALDVSLPTAEDLLSNFNDVACVERFRHHPVHFRRFSLVRANGLA